jgi:hypothetical protein
MKHIILYLNILLIAACAPKITLTSLEVAYRERVSLTMPFYNMVDGMPFYAFGSTNPKLAVEFENEIFKFDNKVYSVSEILVNKDIAIVKRILGQPSVLGRDSMCYYSSINCITSKKKDCIGIKIKFNSITKKVIEYQMIFLFIPYKQN